MGGVKGNHLAILYAQPILALCATYFEGLPRISIFYGDMPQTQHQ